MTQFDTPVIIDAPPSSANLAAGVTAPREMSLRLTATAEKVAAEPVAPALSPIVLAGAVRMIELAVVALIGTAIYVSYVVPKDGVEWHYFGAIAGISVLAMLAFQTADIYQVQAFRGLEKQ